MPRTPPPPTQRFTRFLSRLDELGLSALADHNVRLVLRSTGAHSGDQVHLAGCMYTTTFFGTQEKVTPFRTVPVSDVESALAGYASWHGCCVSGGSPFDRSEDPYLRTATAVIDLEDRIVEISAGLKRKLAPKTLRFHREVLKRETEELAQRYDSCGGGDPSYSAISKVVDRTLASATALSVNIETQFRGKSAFDHELAKIRKGLGDTTEEFLACQLVLAAFSKDTGMNATTRTFVDLCDIDPGPDHVCRIPLYALPTLAVGVKSGTGSRVGVAFIPGCTSDETIRTAVSLWDPRCDGPLVSIQAAMDAALSLALPVHLAS